MSESTEDNKTKDWGKLAEEEAEQDALDDELLETTSSDDSDDPDSHGVLEHPSYKKLEDKLTATEQRAHENWDKAMRAASELENVRKRAERDVSNARKFALENYTKALLPVIDSLEQALEVNTEQATDLVTAQTIAGIELTLQMFLDVLAKHAVKQINPQGEMFDPNLHEAMSMQATDEVEAGTVLTVFQKGYQLHDRVIRPARVVVAKQVTE